MKETHILLVGMILVVLALVSYRATYALFSDSAASAGNIFAASDQFPITPPQESPTPTGIANHLVISEVQINGGPSDAEHDFVEFYNPTSSPFDLNGHRLVSRTGNSSIDNTMKSWTSQTLVPAHGFYLWASNSDAAFSTLVGADTSTSDQLTSSNSIALRNGLENTGTIVDALSWNEGSTLGEGTVFTPNPDADQGLERKALSTSDAASMSSGADVNKGNGFDTNNNATDFILRTLSQPQNTSSVAETP